MKIKGSGLKQRHIGGTDTQLLCLVEVTVYCSSPILLPRRDQGIVYKIGPGNRHLGAFAEKCINNRTIRHDTKRALMLVKIYSIPLCFYLGWSAYLGRCQKFVSGLIIMGIWKVWAAS